MTVAHPPSFPVETMTETQHQKLSQYIAVRQESGVALREPIWLALVIAGDKPACYADCGLGSSTTIMDGWACDLSEQAVPAEMEIEVVPLNQMSPTITVAGVLDAFGLAYQELGGTGWYVARTSWRLGLLPTVRNGSTAAYHRRLGCFFGYTRSDIDYFIATEPPRTQPADLVADGSFDPEEIAYATFIPEIHQKSINRFERAIETGKTIHSRITSLARQWNIPELETLAETVYEEAVTDSLNG